MQQQTFSFAPPSPPVTPTRRNLVIEAGAGTGKTTAIVAEVLKLMLEREDIDPERIVLMTFTEKAAGEIADRIRGALEDLAVILSRADGEGTPAESTSRVQGRGSFAVSAAQDDSIGWPIDSPNPLVVIDDPERARRAIAHHLANIDTLRSQTIHSFCQALLRAFPIEAGLDPQFKIIEGFERSLLYGQLYDAWLDEETRMHPVEEVVHEWELLFAHAGYLFLIRDLILTLINRRDLLGETDYDFGDFDSEVAERITDALIWVRRDSAMCKDPAATRVAAYVRKTPFAGGPIETWIEYLQPIAQNIREIKLPGCGALKEPMTVLRSGGPGESIYDRLVSHRAGMALVSLTRRFLAWLDEEKRKLGVVDFDDLLLRTLALLDDPNVLARARAQFDFIFVDEFQDTDRTQARIIDRLARDASGAYVAGKTIVVGDPKQSIYGFRRADPETYYQMTEELGRGGAERRLITDQYRSDPPLLDVVNAMFARLFPQQLHDPNVFRPAYYPLRAARSANRRELDARITLLHAEHDDKADRYFAEAESIAEWIAARRDGGPRDLQRFAILFRRLTRLDDYLETLRRHGIDYVLPPMRLFLDRRAPVDLLAVLRAIAYPFDLGAQISAARTPYFALTDVEVVAGQFAPQFIPRVDAGSPVPPHDSSLRQGRRGTTGDPASSRGINFRAFTESMSRFREASRHLTVSALIDLITSTCAIERVYDAAVDGDRHMAHLEHVRAIAFSYDQRQGGSVQQFVDEIARRRSEPEEAEPSLVDETQNAVRIMSVHAAKGLEFETVILPDLSFSSAGGGLQLFTVEEPRSIVLANGTDTISAHFRYADGEPLRKIARERDDAESLRLFYVAVTRAQTDVVFVVNPKGWKSGFQKALFSLLPEPQWPDAGREVRMTELGPIAFEKVEVRESSARARRRLHDVALEAELATAEIVPCDIPSPEAPTETLTSAEVAARRAGSRNKAAGILLHRVLELWDGKSDVEPLLQQLSAEAAADVDAVTRVRRRLNTIARSETLRRIARAETLGREMPIRFVEEGITVERRVDRLIRESDRDVVIDYKSGTPEATRASKDREQVARYASAIAAISGRPCVGLVWYVDLESDQVIKC
ncbi:MAG TPA: UvrD-helicase domain-containing protein [Thermoanaerobaculia bacterium]|jgi:ATP-dependent helicase/nuclease subunit A|nr:UvrD-helicase domain-containing protein [Thermoanaerobaculia bacterium]